MRKSGQFLREFVKSSKQIGAVAPSSAFLANRMLKKVDFSTAKVIVELGPGTGVFTKKILNRMSKNAILFVFETNEHFYQLLKNGIKDSRVHFFNESAELISEKLKENNCKIADAVVSSLPLAVIPDEIKEAIVVSAKKVLSKEGYFIQFQYSLNDRKFLKEQFDSVKLDFTAINIPPAFVYNCRK